MKEYFGFCAFTGTYTENTQPLFLIFIFFLLKANLAEIIRKLPQIPLAQIH